MVTVTTKGGERLLARVAAMREKVVPIATASLYRKTQRVMALAKSLCPVATGRLRASGYVADPVISGTVVLVRMGFGTNYAIFVHENILAHHEHGQAKFLELAFYEELADLSAWMRGDILRELRRAA